MVLFLRDQVPSVIRFTVGQMHYLNDSIAILRMLLEVIAI
jgi:hypothetical protein